ncbi:MAG: acyl-CoA dehydrogenase family protein [Syntrophobacteraceae bacterium]
MNFDYTEEQLMFQKMARRFAEMEVRPLIQQMETEKRFAQSLIGPMKENGFYAVHYPEEYGGAGSGFIEFVVMLEELARVYCSVAGHISVSDDCAEAIYGYGTEEQKAKYLPELLNGPAIGSFAFTEPGTGSDPTAIRTTAVRDGNEWVLNGEKIFNTNSTHPGFTIVFCKDVEKDGKLTAIIIPKDVKGYSAPKLMEKMGMHGMEVADFVLEDARVPLENTLGGEATRGKAFNILLDVIAVSKLAICAECVGLAQAALDESVKYAKVRVQRGNPIAKFQTIQSIIGEMAAEVAAARYMVLACADAKSKGKNIIHDAARTRLFVSQVAHRAASNAMQVHGAFSYSTEFPVERIFRDAKLTEVYEGVNEIQRIIAAADLLR